LQARADDANFFSVRSRQQPSGDSARRAGANLPQVVCFDQGQQLAGFHVEQRHQKPQALTRAGVNLHAHVAAGGVGRGHVMKIALPRNVQPLAGM